MRIAIDASSIAKPRRSGVAFSLMNMLDALAKADHDNEYLVCYRLSRLKYRRHFFCPPAGNFRIRIFHEPFPLPRKVDLFHGGDARLPHRPNMLTTVRVHDVFSLIRDDLATGRFREKKQRRYQHIATRATRIIASSHSTLRDLVRVLGVPAQRIIVNHLGVARNFFPRGAEEIERVREKYGIPLPYCLAVAAFSRRKNVHRVLEAYAALKSGENFESSLVLVGSTEHWKDCDQTLQRFGLAGKVVLTGYVPDEDLAPLYAGARMFIFPSLCEGFGLPLLEAMACGTPVISSNVSSMPEVVGDAGLLVDPENVSHLKDAMAELDDSSGLRRELSAKGLQRAKLFTWDRAARQLLDVWKELTGG
jgi:glycosyltransferase involved in cell wall biosynthesis